MKIVAKNPTGLKLFKSGIMEGEVVPVSDGLFKFTNSSYKELLKKSDYDLLIASARPVAQVEIKKVEPKVEPKTPEAEIEKPKRVKKTK